jgi:hypothetical protein
VKLESTVASFMMHPPDAAAALRDFAHATLGKKAPRWAPSAEKIWVFDPSVSNSQ